MKQNKVVATVQGKKRKEGEGKRKDGGQKRGRRPVDRFKENTSAADARQSNNRGQSRSKQFVKRPQAKEKRKKANAFQGESSSREGKKKSKQFLNKGEKKKRRIAKQLTAAKK